MIEKLKIIDGGPKGRFGEAVAQAIAGVGVATQTKDRPLIDRINFEMAGTDLLIWGTNSYVAVRATVPVSAFEGSITSFAVARPDFKTIQRLAKKASVWSIGDDKLETEEGVVAIYRDPPGHKAPNLTPIFEEMRRTVAGPEPVGWMGLSAHVLEVVAKVTKPTRAGFIKLEFPPQRGKPIRGTVGDTELAIMPVNPNNFT